MSPRGLTFNYNDGPNRCEYLGVDATMTKRFYKGENFVPKLKNEVIKEFNRCIDKDERSLVGVAHVVKKTCNVGHFIIRSSPK